MGGLVCPLFCSSIALCGLAAAARRAAVRGVDAHSLRLELAELGATGPAAGERVARRAEGAPGASPRAALGGAARRGSGAPPAAAREQPSPACSDCVGASPREWCAALSARSRWLGSLGGRALVLVLEPWVWSCLREAWAPAPSLRPDHTASTTEDAR